MNYTLKKIKIITNYGDIVILLDHYKAPKTVENFLSYIEKGFYNKTLFHRIIDNFMIQGGGFDIEMKQKPTNKPIENEADNGLKNDIYTIAMARTNDPHSATSQFFINVANNDFLNYSSPSNQGWGYSVFGKVIDGMDTVDKIKKVKTTSKGYHQDVPIDNIIIEKMEIIE